MDTSRPARRPPQVRPLYRALKQTPLPRPWIHGALSAFKRLTVAESVRRRRRLAAELHDRAPGPAELDERSACRLFAPGELPGALETAGRCLQLFEEFQSSGAAAEELQRNPHKAFLLSVVAGNEFAGHPELLRFAVSRPLLEAASRYLATVPVLEGMALWWTPPNDTARSSQAWHVDELAPRQVKVIMNCTEVSADNGPLHYLPAAISERCRAAIGHRTGRIPDEDIERGGAGEHVLAATGPAGSGIVFDSSRCLHFGSRGNRSDRLVLTFHYLPLDAPTETRYRVALPHLPEALEDLDEIQRLALGFS